MSKSVDKKVSPAEVLVAKADALRKRLDARLELVNVSMQSLNNEIGKNERDMQIVVRELDEEAE